jgi:hypothetical protein
LQGWKTTNNLCCFCYLSLVAADLEKVVGGSVKKGLVRDDPILADYRHGKQAQKLHLARVSAFVMIAGLA